MPGGIELEKGSFDWGGGGYQRPADAPGGKVFGDTGLPPGWGEVPPFVEAPPPPLDPPSPGEGRPSVNKLIEPDLTPTEIAQKLSQAILEAVSRPKNSIPEGVTLTDGRARFKGHDIELSTDALTAIKTVLAMEVCRTLQQEQQRVTDSVLAETVQQDSGRERENVPTLPGPESYEREAAEGSEMRRVRITKPPDRDADVLEVPGAEDREAPGSAGDGT